MGDSCGEGSDGFLENKHAGRGCGRDAVFCFLFYLVCELCLTGDGQVIVIYLCLCFDTFISLYLYFCHLLLDPAKTITTIRRKNLFNKVQFVLNSLSVNVIGMIVHKIV